MSYSETRIVIKMRQFPKDELREKVEKCFMKARGIMNDDRIGEMESNWIDDYMRLREMSENLGNEKMMHVLYRLGIYLRRYRRNKNSEVVMKELRRDNDIKLDDMRRVKKMMEDYVNKVRRSDIEIEDSIDKLLKKAWE